ncbi:DUF6770 family protein [Flavobacterium tegetincola]|uniref:DUF6770 family protein n=1 Tax=Flavobacterium tegetincola TaxID=150172 RepID=UPI00047B0456|nr:DUF6770 family protein [Flavobacterium tegetincola]
MNSKQTYILLLLLVIFQNVNAQVQKLYQLSQNKYLGMRVILNEKQDDVWGYSVLYQKDEVEKDVLDLELVILDNNLNKVGSTSFQQFFVGIGSKDELPKIAEQNLKGNTLYFSVGLSGMFNSMPSIYRQLNLNDFTVSEAGIFMNGEIQPFTNIFTLKQPIKNSMVVSLGTSGYLAYAAPDLGSRKTASSETQYPFSVLDLDFKAKWSGTFKKAKKLTNMLSYVYPIHNTDYVLFTVEEEINNKFVTTYDVYDIEVGTKITNFRVADENYLYSNDKLILKKDLILSYDFVFENNKKDLKEENKIIGYSEKVFNLKDGTSAQKILKWDAFKDYFAIDEFGKIDKDFYIYPMDIKTIANGNKLMIFEGFKPGATTQTLDLYAVEFDTNFKILKFLKIEKSMNKWSRINANGSFLKKNGYFDYDYSDKISDDTYAFIYTDNEKLNSIYVSLKPNWVMGIVTFTDGVFSTQKINLSSKDVEISTERAKKGYILLRETNTKDKTTEIRLEKINY